MANSGSDYNRRNRERKRQREIREMVNELAKSYGQKLIAEMEEDTRELLKSMPHPKCPNWKEKSAYDYVFWMCEKGWHKKAKKFIEETLTPIEL